MNRRDFVYFLTGWHSPIFARYHLARGHTHVLGPCISHCFSRHRNGHAEPVFSARESVRCKHTPLWILQVPLSLRSCRHGSGWQRLLTRRTYLEMYAYVIRASLVLARERLCTSGDLIFNVGRRNEEMYECKKLKTVSVTVASTASAREVVALVAGTRRHRAVAFPTLPATVIGKFSIQPHSCQFRLTSARISQTSPLSPSHRQ